MAFSISSIESATLSAGRARMLPLRRFPRRSARFPESGRPMSMAWKYPDADGRAGMATLVADRDLDLRALRYYLTRRLPSYACPLFLRIRDEMEVTATFKYTKTDLVRQGYYPAGDYRSHLFQPPGAGGIHPARSGALSPHPKRPARSTPARFIGPRPAVQFW